MDYRAEKTKNELKECFLYYLSRKPFNRITVTEITRRARLNRGTFYLHYQDTLDLYQDIEADVYHDMAQFFDQAYPSSQSSNLMHLVEALTHYVEQNKALFLLLNQPEAGGKTFHKFRQLFTQKVLQEEPANNSSEYDEIESLFIVSGVIAVIEQWLLEGLTLSQKEVAKHLHQIMDRF